MLENKLYGVVVPLVTPFDGDELDIDSLENLTEYLIEKGIQCLYPAGTTGEMLLLDVEERKEIARSVVNKAAGRVRVYAHTGAMNQRDTILLSKHAADIGADGVGIVTPSFFKISNEELIQYYEGISKSLPDDFPIYLYGIPQCAVNDIDVDTARIIAEKCPNIIGIKYSFNNMSRIIDMMTIHDGKFSVLCGADELYYVTVCAGGDGTVSGNANVIPEHYEAIYSELEADNYLKAKEIQNKTNILSNILSCNNNIARYKAALKYRGIIKKADMRSPLCTLNSKDENAMIKLLEDNGFLTV